MSDLRATYNMIAKDWHRDHQDDDWWIEGTNKFLSYLKKDERVLDVGCGGGTKSCYLISHGMRVVGIDLSDEMINICQHECPEGEFKQMDMREIDKLADSFDAILAQACLLHIPKREVLGVVRQFNKKLATNGYCYIAVKEKINGVDEEQLEESDYGYKYSRFFSYYTEEEMRGYLDGAEFEVIDVFRTPAKKNSWLQLLGRKK